MGFETRLLLTAAVGAVAAALLTPIARAVAERVGLVARPRDDRWNARATPLLGGAAFVVAFALALGGAVGAGLPSGEVLAPGAAGPVTGVAGVLVGAVLAFGLGLLDDVRELAPATKLAGQVVACAAAVSLGDLGAPLGAGAVGGAVATVWLVATSNAFNFVDNMDGLAPGLGLVAAGVLLVLAAAVPHPAPAVVAAAGAGALLGFLPFNRRPARIFLGDAGSLPLGLILGSVPLLIGAAASSRPVLTALVGASALALPLFDAAFVTCARLAEGRPTWASGLDHLSHRLVARGIGEGPAVRGLVALGLASALPALVAARTGLVAWLPLTFAAVAVLLGTFAYWLVRPAAWASPAPPSCGAD